MQDKYINPFTDFGVKKLFGEEPHKELLTGRVPASSYLSRVIGDMS